MKLKIFTLAPIALAVALTGCNSSTNEHEQLSQPELESRIHPVLEVDGYQFRDLDGDGKLAPYEDWRLTVDERADDLLSRMTLEEKVGMMLISTQMMGRDKLGLADGRLNEEDKESSYNWFDPAVPTLAPMMEESAATKGIQERHLRRFIARDNESAYVSAVWANNLQETAENTRLGIPVLIASNPRNHLAADAGIGVSVGETVFSSWPGELGLAATQDAELVKEFAEMAAKEWVSTGLRKGYQYMADLATEPRWERVSGTFGEDANLAAEMIKAVTEGFQGEKLGKYSVALTTKHFPGGGPQLDGADPHFSFGKEQHYPGGMFDYHLIPFQAAIDAGTASIMPYYAMPINATSDLDFDFEEIAFAYNKGIINDLLRDEMGFEGIVNSDTGPIFWQPWGMEDKNLNERYQKALGAGIDLFSGNANPEYLLETVNSGMVSEQRISESVRRLLKEKFELGIFEDPYVDPDLAREIAGNAAFQKKGDIALRKSIVLLENQQSVLPLQVNTKVYFEKLWSDQQCGSSIGDNSELVKGTFAATNNLLPASEEVKQANLKRSLGFESDSITVVDDVNEADTVVLVLLPNNCGLFAATDDPILLGLSDNNIDVDYINTIASLKDTVLVVNFTSPWSLEELNGDALKTVVATFGTTDAAISDVLTGKFNPTGKMPISIPMTQADADNNDSDVPGHSDDKVQLRWKFDDGQSYQ
ncbi:glycoside hydrolase family 3 protein [Psychromonas ossibalaenae]|uniref:glycoside hydrolase family 3 protein n=1 Tax=Psychromonas ossibalaenae TaxID=444922 RepID=UPI00035DFBBC|nr:glycoside hydrolase family 3 N-terminal domain-containing protein [Psychromonas ossibalaenae]